MHDVFEWIWLNLLSPLLLPVFMILILATVAGARPDGVLKIVLDFALEVISLSWRAATQIADLFARQCFKRGGPTYPRPKLPVPRRSRSEEIE
ncbi:MAG: hypothetical protein KC777_26660 [Cyanobacteria bacterium HKST-UBA02]|nr:hypothetical protein [Cyanobacteria bacterium HKST-UBA02]